MKIRILIIVILFSCNCATQKGNSENLKVNEEITDRKIVGGGSESEVIPEVK